MISRRTLLVSSIALLPAIAAADDILCGRRIRPRCLLPPYPYPHDKISNPVSIRGLRMIRYRRDGSVAPAGDLVVTSANSAASRGIENVPLSSGRRKDDVLLKTFQMETERLDNDHCRISLLTVTVSSEGDWLMHLVAEQNPEIVEVRLRPEFEKYKRNQFVIDLRPTGLMTINQSEMQSVLAKPEFPSIPVQEFWVSKHQISRIQRQGHDSQLLSYFPVLEQLEVHFSYR